MNNLISALQTNYSIILDTDEIENIKSLCSLKKIKKGEYFLKAGEIPLQLGFNAKGIFRFFYIDKDGNYFTKYFCTENFIISSYSAMISKTESKYFIEALEDSEVFIINYCDIEVKMRNNYKVLLIMKNICDKALIMKEKRESGFLLENGSERYLNFLIEYPHLENRVKQYYIASYLGLTPESLSRIKNNLKK